MPNTTSRFNYRSRGRLVFSAETGSGSVCIAPVPETVDGRSAPGLSCDPHKLSLKIDNKTMAWSMKESLKIDALDVAARHRVVVFCDGKPQQAFEFRFSEFKSADLCLFLNDLYRTVQLSEVKRCPWCKCK
jgi:hypothetical protein